MEPHICRDCGRVHLNYGEWLIYHGTEYHQLSEDELQELCRYIEENYSVDDNDEEE